MAFYTIFISSDLAEDVRRKAGKDFPGPYTPADQTGLLRSARFGRIEGTDVTDEFLRIQKARVAAYKRHAKGLRRALGVAEYERRLANRARDIKGIEDGVFRRALFVAQRLAPRRRR